MENKPILYPFKRLLYSRKFLVLVLDTVISMILHFVGGESVQFLITALQPVALMIIGAIAAEDIAQIKNGG
jgi:hypothetical protein